MEIKATADVRPTGPAASTSGAHGLLPNLDAFPTTGYSRWRDLAPFVRFSREWVRLQEAAGRFPRGTRASATLVVWPNAEIKRWLADPLNYRAEGQ